MQLFKKNLILEQILISDVPISFHTAFSLMSHRIF